MDEKITLLVVDDHTVVRKGLCALLSAEKYGIEVVGEAADGLEAVEKASQLKPQVILMDIMMPKMDGLQSIITIRRENPDARILVMTSYAEDDLLLKAIDAGALGYLMKDASPDVLVSTIKNVFLNRMSLPMNSLQKVIRRGDDLGSASPASLLTERELDVLR